MSRNQVQHTVNCALSSCMRCTVGVPAMLATGHGNQPTCYSYQGFPMVQGYTHPPMTTDNTITRSIPERNSSNACVYMCIHNRGTDTAPQQAHSPRRGRESAQLQFYHPAGKRLVTHEPLGFGTRASQPQNSRVQGEGSSFRPRPGMLRRASNYDPRPANLNGGVCQGCHLQQGRFVRQDANFAKKEG